jgi:hypothetical protein
MFKQSGKVAKLWDQITTQLSELDDEVADPIRDGMDEACKFESFEATDRAYRLLLEYFPVRAANLTYFFDPNDGCYGYFSTLSEKNLLKVLKSYRKKIKR